MNANGRIRKDQKTVTGEPCGGWELSLAEPGTTDCEELRGDCSSWLFPRPSNSEVPVLALSLCWGWTNTSNPSPEIAPR